MYSLKFAKQLRLVITLIKSVAQNVAYQIILLFDGSGVLEGFSIENITDSSPKNEPRYQLILKGNFSEKAINLIQPVLNENSLQMNLTGSNTIVISATQFFTNGTKEIMDLIV